MLVQNITCSVTVHYVIALYLKHHKRNVLCRRLVYLLKLQTTHIQIMHTEYQIQFDKYTKCFFCCENYCKYLIRSIASLASSTSSSHHQQHHNNAKKKRLYALWYEDSRLPSWFIAWMGYITCHKPQSVLTAF